MPYSNKPTLTATENEFLLFIHPEIKERAKVIRGYRWDPERRCWVYPRTQQVWDALVAEFGEELRTASLVRPASREQPPVEQVLTQRVEELERENAALRQAIDESVDALVDADLDRASMEQSELVRELEETRAQQEKARLLYEARIADLEREARGAAARREQAMAELEAARKGLATLQSQLIEASRGSDWQARLKQMALEATGNDSGFAAILDGLDLSDSLPLKAARLLEDQLRLLLRVPAGQRGLDLYDLIRQAEAEELLPRDAIEMAHLIRRQRNTIAHAEAYEKTYQARSVLCLLAIALLWPELPE